MRLTNWAGEIQHSEWFLLMVYSSTGFGASKKKSRQTWRSFASDPFDMACAQRFLGKLWPKSRPEEWERSVGHYSSVWGQGLDTLPKQLGSTQDSHRVPGKWPCTCTIPSLKPIRGKRSISLESSSLLPLASAFCWALFQPPEAWETSAFRGRAVPFLQQACSLEPLLQPPWIGWPSPWLSV